MKRKPASKSAFFNPRVLVGLAFCSIGLLLALFAFALYPGGKALAQGPEQNQSETQKLAQEALPEEWDKSTNPNRMVPILLPSSEFLIVVTGDPKRNRNTVYRNNHMQGFATSKKIKLPANWEKMMAEIKK